VSARADCDIRPAVAGLWECVRVLAPLFLALKAQHYFQAWGSAPGIMEQKEQALKARFDHIRGMSHRIDARFQRLFT